MSLDLDLDTRDDRIVRALSKIESRNLTPLNSSLLAITANREDPKLKEARLSFLDQDHLTSSWSFFFS